MVLDGALVAALCSGSLLPQQSTFTQTISGENLQLWSSLLFSGGWISRIRLFFNEIRLPFERRGLLDSHTLLKREKENMKPNEMIVLGVVVFIAIVVSILWIDHERDSITKAQGHASLEPSNEPPTIIKGFAGAVCA
jgi:hypothetical protein